MTSISVISHVLNPLFNTEAAIKPETYLAFTEFQAEKVIENYILAREREREILARLLNHIQCVFC